MSKTAAAFFISIGKLCTHRQTIISTITVTAPYNTAAGAAFLGRFYAHQFPETLVCEILLPGPDL